MSTDLTAGAPAPESSGPDAAEVNPGAPLPGGDQSAEPVYGAHYYDTYAGGRYEYEGHWLQWFGQLADNIIRQFQPRTVLDAGCAKGFLVQALRERGVEAYGIDASEYAIEHAPETVRPYLSVGSITEPLKDRYDLITCIEVIEHLPPADLPRAASVLASATDRLLLSSTAEGAHLAEPSHQSMHPPEDWAALFAGEGLLRALAEDVTWLTPWAMVLERRVSPTVVEIVRDYERRIARDVREIYELRRSAIELESRLDDLYREGAQGRVDAAEARAAELAIENLRLRDLLIVVEREAGQAQGQVQTLGDTLQGYKALADRYHEVMSSTTWRLSWALLAPLRKLRAKLGR
jgi:SAM-dependent methyltransferase